jgi:transcription initiation factor IIF auxiliary subunit
MYLKIKGMFSRYGDRLFEKVEFLLHPSFKKPLITKIRAPYEIVKNGWGLFVIKVTITWKSQLKMEPTKLEHMLVFEKEGSKSVFSIMVKKSLLPPELKAIANRTIKNDVQEIIRKR